MTISIFKSIAVIPTLFGVAVLLNSLTDCSESVAMQPLQNGGKAADNSSTHTAPIVAREIPDLTIVAGFPFEFDARPAGSITLGLDEGGANLRMTDNVFASSVFFLKPWTDVTFSRNTVRSESPFRALSLLRDSGEDTFADYVWDRNSYVSNTDRPFLIDGETKDWVKWKAESGLDGASTFRRSMAGTLIKVRPNKYEVGRGHVVVFNWNRAPKVSVDLSEILQPGTSFQMFDVLDVHGPPVVAGIWNGEPISVRMVDRDSPRPIGHSAATPLRLTNEFATFLVLSDVGHLSISGKQYFVSVNGSSIGDGSVRRPWNIDRAMSHPREVNPGDTIFLRGGIYRGSFNSRLSGSDQKPIRVRAYPGEEVIIDLNDADDDQAVITIDGQFTQYSGLEILNSSNASRYTNQTGPWPSAVNRGNINVTGDYIKLINCEIHDLNKGLGFWESAVGGEVYGSLIYNNGWVGGDRRHGHAIYSQNAGQLRRFSDNVIYNQFQNGIHVFGSSDAKLDNHHLEGNVVFNNGAAVGTGFSGNFQILVGGGQFTRNITLHQNYSYVSGHHFVDPSDGSGLEFVAKQSNGQPLPNWMTFFPREGYFTGTPQDADVGTIEVSLTAINDDDVSTTETFRLHIRSGQSSTSVSGEN